ncbi:MAG TPA: hypothetical protein VK841_11995 [Polyangiaceae bacterium]|jgi:hypothetical protein|nr:hypothetical protein [Polyangiaceae bacterium]
MDRSRWLLLVICALSLYSVGKAGTAVWWGPLMVRLEDPGGGLAIARFHLLMNTHWLLVAIVTAYGVLTLWMVAQSAWLGRLT